MWDWLKWLCDAPDKDEPERERKREEFRQFIAQRTPNWRAPHQLVLSPPKPPKKAKHA